MQRKLVDLSNNSIPLEMENAFLNILLRKLKIFYRMYALQMKISQTFVLQILNPIFLI